MSKIHSSQTEQFVNQMSEVKLAPDEQWQAALFSPFAADIEKQLKWHLGNFSRLSES